MIEKKVRLSRWLNGKLGGDPRIMVSTRCYVQDRTKLTWCIDLLFWLLRGEMDHCHNAFMFDMKPRSKDHVNTNVPRNGGRRMSDM